MIAMALKGLPAEYKTFSAIVSKSDEKDEKMKFQEFKTALRSYEETEKSCTPQQSGEDSVMNLKPKSPPGKQLHNVVFLRPAWTQVGPRTRRRKETTDGVATASRRRTTRTYVLRKTLRKSCVIISVIRRTLHLRSK